MTKTDPVSSAYATFNKAIDRVLKESPGPARWRAAVDFWLTLDPRHKQQYKQVVRDNKIIRSGLTNKYGLGEEKNLRNYLSIPHGAYYAIFKADPQAFSKKENAKKMFKTFPEFTTSEVY